MNKYIIHCTTAWCGVYEDYAALAESEVELDDIAQDLAYSLFCENDGWDCVMEEAGYDPEEMSEEDRDKFYESVDEGMYYGYNIEQVEDEETLEFWKECNLVYDGSKE